MIEVKKKLKVTLNNDLIFEGCDPEFLEKFCKEHFFEYDEKTKIKELYVFLLKEINVSYYNDVELSERFAFDIGERRIHANVNYELDKFLNNHKINSTNIQLFFYECVGGGNGAIIEELGQIRINPNEGNHKYIPHVHIYKTNPHECVRIDLITLQEFKNDKYKLSDFFSKKEIKKIMEILNNYRNDFITFYNQIQNGEAPKSFIISYNNEDIVFK